MKFKNTSYIFNQDDWYLLLEKEINKYIIEYEIHRKNLNDKALQIYRKKREYFINLIQKKLDIIKSNTSLNEFYFDKDRKNIDTIVIHHTSRHWKTSINKIETIHLLNLYIREFLNDCNLRGQKIFSGHIYNNKPTFFAYHYIVFNDGSYIKPLKDEYIGWHSGNSEFNKRSIAICVHDDLHEKTPNIRVIKTIKNIILNYKIKNILGHCEIKSSTDCPGNRFMGPNGWKNLLY